MKNLQLASAAQIQCSSPSAFANQPNKKIQTALLKNPPHSSHQVNNSVMPFRERRGLIAANSNSTTLPTSKQQRVNSKEAVRLVPTNPAAAANPS